MSDEPYVSNTAGEAFDPTEIDELVNDVGPQSAARLLMRCIVDVRERVARLQDLPSDDLATVHGLAHQLKGLFAQFGAHTASAEAAALEACGSPQAFALRAPIFQGCAMRALAWFEEQHARLAPLA